MTKAIQQSVEFEVSPETLYETYVNSRKHSASTGAPAKLGRKVGAKFTAFDGSLLGRNLLLVPNKMIVQAWRADHWKAADTDSILVLTFTKTAKGARVDLVHANVPEHDHRGVSEGWRKYYWNPWQAYFARLAS
jgi:activator of HSP90 ATPase